MHGEREWWRGAVIYQVYPRSLADSNGDGIGDLPGITGKLQYIADLGVDAVWISPFFKSPMKDFGYDVADFRAVDPLFGTLEDFDRLLERAHQLGLKVIIDMVLSHTSDQHQWFQESRGSRDNPRADWYVWANPRPDGTPPNNWLSIFGGPAWQWDSRREQYYLHNFLVSQPDLNFHHPAVVEQALDEVRFWLDRGVDGLRLDAINFCFHDLALRDNPSKPADERQSRGFTPDNPYAYQRHLYDNTRPENLQFLERLRQLMDQYPGVVALGEVSSEDSPATMAEYTAPGRLHMAYSFDLLQDEGTPAYIRRTVGDLDRRVNGGWICWSVGNHDVRRVMTRWGAGRQEPELAKVIAAAHLSLRGSQCIYQGEELGLTEVEIAEEHLRDPYGIAFWPRFKGRDGCRTPFPWTDHEPGAGFTDGESWLPIAEEHRPWAVSRQHDNPDSVLNHYRQLLRWRRDQPALLTGSIHFEDEEQNEHVLAFWRRAPEQHLYCCFNLSAQHAEIALPIGCRPVPALDLQPMADEGRIVLPPYGHLFAEASA